MKLFIQILLNEKWKPITYPKIKKDMYLISDHGRIKNIRKGNIIKAQLGKVGYFRCGLCTDNNNGVAKRVSIHRLVAHEFIPNLDNKPTVNHKDMVKINNYVDNLEWATKSEQTQHAMKTGPGWHHKGENHGMSTFSNYSVDIISQQLEKNKNVGQIIDAIRKFCPEYNDRSRGSLRGYIGKIRRRERRTDVSNKYIF